MIGHHDGTATRANSGDGADDDPVADDPGLDAFLHPRAIAVVGASSDPATIAGLLFANLLESHFAGVVFPVNKKNRLVQGVTAYPDLASCPVVADLVIVCVPAKAAAGVIGEAGELGVKAVCVISAGFAETGRDGAGLQAMLVDAATNHGVRLVGPNCTGILSGSGAMRFNATFSRTVPPEGRASLVSQSGAVGLAVLEAAAVRGLGIGAFVSVGNSVDVASNDLLETWGRDRNTELVLLYLESFQDASAFVRVARNISRRIPIVAVKAGRTKAGRRGAASHTAALGVGEAGTNALLRQAGIIRADSIEDMVDLATVLSSQQLFRGRKVAILTNGGGPGVLAADACENNGLVVPELDTRTKAALASLLPAEASVANPVDMIAAATAPQYGQAVRVLAATDIDALIVMFNTPLLTRACDVADELVAARAEVDNDVPIVSVFMNTDGPPPVLREAGIPSFNFPENAVRALARSITWAERRNHAPGKLLRPEVNTTEAARLVTAAADRGEDWLSSADAESLLRCYGIDVPRCVLVNSAEEAAAAQRALGCTVVVKLATSLHKSDIGGVRLGLATADATADAVRAIRTDLAAAGVAPVPNEMLVQEQVTSGIEMIAGISRDPQLGPLVMVGLGGKLVELLDDVAFGLSPLTDTDVEDMLQSLKSYRLLNGYRGTPPLDLEALRQVLHRLSALAEDIVEIAEIDLNPVFVLETGAVAADVRIRLSHDTDVLDKIRARCS
jgi:acyl-CoA synthetase (NDP forming)